MTYPCGRPSLSLSARALDESVFSIPSAGSLPQEDYESVGRVFESPRARHFFQDVRRSLRPAGSEGVRRRGIPGSFTRIGATDQERAAERD